MAGNQENTQLAIILWILSCPSDVPARDVGHRIIRISHIEIRQVYGTILEMEVKIAERTFNFFRISKAVLGWTNDSTKIGCLED